MPDLGPVGDFFNPFTYLGGAAGKVVADGWTAAMLGLWNAGLWALRLVLTIMDAFLTPDLSGDGPGAELFRSTFWIAGVLVVLMAMIQFGVAAARRDGRSLAQVAIGFGQFVIVWAAWIAYGVVVIAACGGLTRALMQALLRVDSWSAWQPWQAFSVEDIADGTVATVLGLMGLLVWLAAIGHLLVMLTRGGALLVLAATTPISAAGLLADAGRSWFWKSLRWFHAAALTPVVMILVLGIGVQMTSGVATGLEGTQAAIGTALPGVILILIGCFSPLALFKLLAFVDPGTPSGAALRQGLATSGGLQGLLGGASGAASGSSAASATDQNGRSQGESAGEDATSARFTQAEGGLLSKVGGVAGPSAAQGLGVMQSLGAKGAAIGADLSNQMGVGHQSYHPDFSGLGGRGQGGGGRGGPGTGRGPGESGPDDDAPDGGAPAGPNTVADPSSGAAGAGRAAGGPDLPTPSPTPVPGAGGQGSSGSGSSTGGSGGAGPKGAPGGGGSAGAGGAEAAAATVPVVPV